MQPIERVQCVLAGQKPDRPPVSFWYHFPPEKVSGAPAADAHIQHLDTYGLDFLKVMNDNGYPHDTPISRVEDCSTIVELRGDEGAFGRQLELLGRLKEQLRGRVFMITTIFNAWAVMRHLVRPPGAHNPPEMDASADEPSLRLKAFYARAPRALSDALATIGRNLARFAAKCIEAGADGIFLSVRDDWVDATQGGRLYEQVVRPTDLDILRAVSNAPFNMLHVCGRAIDFPAFASYPVHAINWADRAAGPSIADVGSWLKPAICAGVDNLTTLPNGTPEDCRRQVADALQQAQNRPIMIAPGCTFDPARVPAANLHAVCDAVRSHS